MASWDLLLSGQLSVVVKDPHSPDTAQADERDPRARRSAFLLDSIE